jgi:hypothetical protein
LDRAVYEGIAPLDDVCDRIPGGGLAVAIQKEFNAKAQRRQDAKEKQTWATENSRSPNSETQITPQRGSNTLRLCAFALNLCCIVTV